MLDFFFLRFRYIRSSSLYKFDLYHTKFNNIFFFDISWLKGHFFFINFGILCIYMYFSLVPIFEFIKP